MALPIMKIFTAIKDDYQNLRLERGWIDLKLKEDPDISLIITPYGITIRVEFARLSIPYEDDEDLRKIQDCITNAIVFIRDFIEEIEEYHEENNSRLLTEGNTIWVKE